MPSQRAIHIAILTIFALICLSLSRIHLTAPTDRTSQTPKSILERSSDPPTCGFAGNPDIYGLGVRLGLYLQWLTALITRLSSPSPDSVRDLLDTDGIFLLALLIATILLAIGSVGPVHSVEILILLHLFFGDVFVILWNAAYLDYKRSPLSLWGLNCRAMIIVGLSAFATWFWFRGEEHLLENPCGDFAFLFARVAIHGHVRTFFKAITVINLAYWILNLEESLRPALELAIGLDGALSIWCQSILHMLGFEDPTWFNRNENRYHVRFLLVSIVVVFGEPFWELSSRVSARRGLPPPSSYGLPGESKGWLCVQAFILLWSILAIELIIRWNQITGVNTIRSTGQIIPLILSLGSLWKVVISATISNVKESHWSAWYYAVRSDKGRWHKFDLKWQKRRQSLPPRYRASNERTVMEGS